MGYEMSYVKRRGDGGDGVAGAESMAAQSTSTSMIIDEYIPLKCPYSSK